MDEKERIEKIMQTEELTAAIFAAEIGIQGSTLSHILNGRNKPSLDVLKKILNRFSIISSDWLILGIGSMYRSELKSQTPTLFDNYDESPSKSANSSVKYSEKNVIAIEANQKKSVNLNDNGSSVPIPVTEKIISEVQTNKTVQKIIVYYTDNTFQEFVSK